MGRPKEFIYDMKFRGESHFAQDTKRVEKLAEIEMKKKIREAKQEELVRLTTQLNKQKK